MIGRGIPVLCALLLAGACTGEVSGGVRDAATGEPVGGARVSLYDSGWGISRGSLVWDKSYVYEAVSKPDGTFSIAHSGGVRLEVEAPDGNGVTMDMCARSPQLILIGGPYPSLETDEILYLPVPGEPAARATWRGESVWASDFGLTFGGSAFGDGHELIVEAPFGAIFVPGTGAIPPAPPMPWPRTMVLDTKACGWLFVSDGSRPVAVVQVRKPGWERDPDGSQRYTLLYTRLP